MKPGFLLINKPKNWTSHDVVGYIRNIARKVTGDKKIRVGHAGTLDPFATGLLIIGVGKGATRRLDEFKALSKTYVATLRLGYVSDTFDSTGNITNTPLLPLTTGHAGPSRGNLTPSLRRVGEVLSTFTGKQQQTPPMYSAKKVNGKKLYELARKGIEIERKTCDIEITHIKILGYSWPTLTIEVQCSSGTYIRTIAHDIGQKLGCGAYCEELERTQIGNYNLNTAHKPNAITPKILDTLSLTM